VGLLYYVRVRGGVTTGVRVMVSGVSRSLSPLMFSGPNPNK